MSATERNPVSKWTLWVVENELHESDSGTVTSCGDDIVDILTRDRFEDAYAEAVEERRENPAAVCVYITKNGKENIWYAMDTLTGEGVYCGPGITDWRAALATATV